MQYNSLADFLTLDAAALHMRACCLPQYICMFRGQGRTCCHFKAAAQLLAATSISKGRSLAPSCLLRLSQIPIRLLTTSARPTGSIASSAVDIKESLKFGPMTRLLKAAAFADPTVTELSQQIACSLMKEQISSRFQKNCNRRVHLRLTHVTHAAKSDKVQGANAARPPWRPRQRVPRSEPQPWSTRRSQELH